MSSANNRGNSFGRTRKCCGDKGVLKVAEPRKARRFIEDIVQRLNREPAKRAG